MTMKYPQSFETLLDVMAEVTGTAMRQVRDDIRREIANLETRIHALEVQVDAERNIRTLAERTTRELGTRDAQLAVISRQLDDLDRRLGALPEAPGAVTRLRVQ
jgi:hypothetical protein